MKKSICLLFTAAMAFASCENDSDNPQFEFVTLDFESAGDYLAGPTAYGENLYADYQGEKYTGYYDPATDLEMKINEEDPYGGEGVNFWNGGVAISQWNDMTGDTYLNQCSVYYADGTTGFGGHNGSRTFAVVMGNNNEAFQTDTRASIGFRTPGEEKVFDHIWVANSTYNYLSVTRGSEYSPAYSHETQDWFKLVVEGLDKDGLSVGKAEAYLSDYRNQSSPGALAGWYVIDLRPLGRVHSLRFDLQGSDDNGYGTAMPVYFCIDDITIVKEMQ